MSKKENEFEKIEKEEINEDFESGKLKKEVSTEVEVGNFKDHVEAARKGLYEYKIWNSLTYAFIQMGFPNEEHRLDLRDTDMLNKIAKELKLDFKLEVIQFEISKNPWLVSPNGVKTEKKDETKDDFGKKLTKKQIKLNEKKKKQQKC